MSPAERQPASPDRLAPIGVFDSGLGGLSVLREIRRLLPHEDLLYVSDSAHVPYGDKTEAHIRERSLLLARFLQAQGAKALSSPATRRQPPPSPSYGKSCRSCR